MLTNLFREQNILKCSLVVKILVSSKQSNWAKYFEELNDSNEEINKFTQIILDRTTSSSDRDSVISSLSKDKGDSILLFYCSATKSLKSIHSVMDVGNTTWFPDNLLVALDGFSRPSATPVLLDIDSMLVESELEIPTVNRLVAVKMGEDFKNLDVSRSAGKFKSLPFIVVPPFLWETVMKIGNKEFDTVFMEILKEIDNFIKRNEKNADLNSISRTTCGNLLTFIWCSAKGEIPSIRLIPSGDNEMILNWCNIRHSNCIESAEGVSRESDPTRISTAEEIPRSAPMTTTTVETGEKKSFMKLDESVRNLILNASAPTTSLNIWVLG